MPGEIKAQTLEADTAEKILIGSAALAASGVVVAAGDFIRYAGQDALHFVAPERFVEAHKLFDTVGHYGLGAIAAGCLGFLGGALAGRVTDRLNAVRE